MRNGYRVLDTDSHMMEPPSIWRDYIDPNFADRAPQIGDMGNGRPGMMVEGESITRQDGNYPMHSREFLEAAARGMEKHEAARAAGFDPKSRLHDMDEHGVDAQVIYPTVGGQMLGKPFHDTELLAAVCRAYNDWSLEYCSHAPERLRHGGDAAGAGAGPRRRGSAPGGAGRGCVFLRPAQPRREPQPVPRELRGAVEHPGGTGPADVHPRLGLAPPAVVRRPDGDPHLGTHHRPPVRGDGGHDEPDLVRDHRAPPEAQRRARRGGRGVAPLLAGSAWSSTGSSQATPSIRS